MELRYMTTPEEYSKFIKRFNIKRFLKLSAIGAAVFLLIMLVISGHKHYSPKGYAVQLGIDIIYFGIIFLALRIKNHYAIQKSIKKIGLSTFNHPKIMTLGEKGLEVKSISREIKVPYNEIQSFSNDNEFITIKFKATDMVYIPIGGIQNPENKDAFFLELSKRISQRP